MIISKLPPITVFLLFATAGWVSAQSWDFAYELKHVNQADADGYVAASDNVRKYSEWQNPPVTYWGPAANGTEGSLTFRFDFPRKTSRIHVLANISSYNFSNGGGRGTGSSSVWASVNGRDWTLLVDCPVPSRIDSYRSHDALLPAHLAGAKQIWIQARFRSDGAPNTNYTTAQFGRSTSAAQTPVFAVRADFLPGDWDFDYRLKHVNDAEADRYIVSARNIRKYSEWQNPPVTYWGPTINDAEASLTFKFPFARRAARIHLRGHLSSYNFSATSRGQGSLWGSKDGVNWILLLDCPVPDRIDAGATYDALLPDSLSGGNELWLQVRLGVRGAPNTSYTLAQFLRATAANTEPVFSVQAEFVPEPATGQTPRPNTFMLQSAQAGSTTDIDNLRVVDLDSGRLVYANDFTMAAQATNRLNLYYYPQGGSDTFDYVVNGPMTRVVGGKLRLETTGFNRNGSGGYESHSEAEFNGRLPRNFLVEFDAVRLQWPGHFHFHVFHRAATDAPGSHAPGGAFSTNRNPALRVDLLRMAASGSWFQTYGIFTNAASPSARWGASFPAPAGNLMNQHRLGISLSNSTARFYVNGNLLESLDVTPWLAEYRRPRPPVDLNQDGLTDLVWHHAGTGQAVAWLLHGTKRYANQAIGRIGDVLWKIAGVEDLSGDGSAEILWQQEGTGSLALWEIGSAGLNRAVPMGRMADLQWKIVGTGDFDADGRGDIVWQHAGTGMIVVWYMNNTLRQGSAVLGRVGDRNWQIVGVGDLNNDGHPDLIWRHAAHGTFLVWWMNQTTRVGFRVLPAPADRNWQLGATGDLNNDGQTDLVWHHGGDGRVEAWFMDGATRTGTAQIGRLVDSAWRLGNR